MEERKKKLLGYSLVLKCGETDSGLNRALGVKRLLGRGHLLYLSVVGHFFIGLLSVLVQRTSLASCLKGVVHCEWRTTIAHLAHPLEFGCSSFWAGSHL